MKDESHRPASSDVPRRAFLTVVGTSAIAATAGCLLADDSGQNASEQDETTAQGTEEGANNRSSMVNATNEQSIITTETTRTTTTPTAQEPTTASTTQETLTKTPYSERPATSSSTSTITEGTRTETATDTSTPPSTAGKWDGKEPLPVDQSDAGGGVLDGKLYVYGGIKTASELDAVTRAFAYDPTDGSGGSWSRIDDLPQALWGNCGVATDTALYSFGGAPEDAPYSGPPPSDAIFRYTPDSGWENLTATQDVRCPYRNWVMKGLYNPADGLIYCVGGGTVVTDRASATDHGVDGEVPGTYDESRIWSYDPEAEQVANSDLARMPEAKRWTSVALVEVEERQYIHAIGGLLGTTGPTDSNFRYDIEAGRWERMRPIPMQGTYATHSNPVIRNQVYLTHGMFWEGRSTIDRYKLVAHRYDPTTDSFETGLSKPQHLRGGATCGVINGRLYVVGGHLKRFDQDGLHDCVAYNESFVPSE